MSFARVFGAQPSLLHGEIITVEIDTAKGLHSFTVVGLPDKAVDESRDRVSAALKNSSFQKHETFKAPKNSNQKIVVSLAPAHSKKEGSYFDVPIALAYAVATNELKPTPEQSLFVGELSLDGELRSIRGALVIAEEARRRGFTSLYVPPQNADEAALVTDLAIYAPRTLTELIEHLRGATLLEQHTRTHHEPVRAHQTTRLEDIKGQEHAKRGLTIAAAGGHNIALFGPPGTGKTLLARALASLLPPLSPDEILEVTGIHSVAGTLKDSCMYEPPIRTPHHTASYVSLVGGGATPRPGEVTLAHRGVLFLDEFPEFDRRVINALRQPLEDGVVSITRAKGSATFPSQFILIAALNPCPCGYYGTNKCTCSAGSIVRYQQKISGPIMDRIDMWIEVGAVDHHTLLDAPVQSNETESIKQAVATARSQQATRFKRNGRLNSGMSVAGLVHHCVLSDSSKDILNTAATRLSLSPRAYHRVVKLARTIADLESSTTIEDAHILEALSYRPKNEW